MHNFKSLGILFSKASYKPPGRGRLPASSVCIGGLGCESCCCDGAAGTQGVVAGRAGRQPGGCGVSSVCHLTLHTPQSLGDSAFAFHALFIWLAVVASILNMLKSANFSVV